MAHSGARVTQRSIQSHGSLECCTRTKHADTIISLQVWVFVQANVFASGLPIAERYDLKGSWAGRSAGTRELAKGPQARLPAQNCQAAPNRSRPPQTARFRACYETACFRALDRPYPPLAARRRRRILPPGRAARARRCAHGPRSPADASRRLQPPPPPPPPPPPRARYGGPDA